VVAIFMSISGGYFSKEETNQTRQIYPIDRGGNMMGAGVRRGLSQHPQLSSPGSTGRSSIPETPEIEPRCRGVLDAPVKPGHDGGVWRDKTSDPPSCHSAPVLPDGATIIFVLPNFRNANDFHMVSTVHGVVFAFFVFAPSPRSRLQLPRMSLPSRLSALPR
jgi:hypothetical protein